MVRRPGHPERARLFQDLIVPGGFVVRVKEDVGVRLDEAGEEGRASERDALGARGHGDLGGGTGSFDSFAPDHHPPSGVEALAVEDPCGLDRVELREQKTNEE